MTDGLVAYYPFNGNANDESGNGNHGIIIGNVELVADKDGNPNSAYRFPGQPLNYISVPDNEVLHCSTFTLCAWVYTDSEDYGHGYLINKGRDITNGSYRLYVKGVGSSVKYGGTNDAQIDFIPETKVWHFIAGTVEGDIAKFYLDGILMDERTLSFPFEYSNSEPLTLGMHYYSGVPSMWAYPLNGVLDEVRIYNRALTDNEIKQLAQDVDLPSFFVCPDEHHPHLIDLGLPSGTKWACCNIGANSPEEYGDYYAWGEIETKSVYNWSTYKWCNGSQFSMNKYCNNPDYGNIDNKTLLEPEDDAAYMNWGPAWRMPTREQQDEIRNNCDWIWAIYKNVSGMLIKSRINDSFVFLPAAGYISGASPSNTANYGYYQSASLDLDVSDDSYYFYFNSQGHYWNDFSTTVGRDVGFSVRPISITTASIPISSIALAAPYNYIEKGETVKIDAIIKPSDASNKNLDWRSYNENVATVSNGIVTGVGKGLTTIFASAKDGSGIQASILIRVKDSEDAPQEVPIYANRGFDIFKGKIPVNGLTADGKSQVFITLPNDINVILSGNPKVVITDLNGQNLYPEQSEIGSISPLQTKYGEQGFVYEAPIDFIQSYRNEYYLANILVPVETGSEPSYEVLTSVRIYRPGLLLVHGLWGYPTSFEEFGNYLDNHKVYNPLYHLVDYSASHSDTFFNNTHVNNVIDKACRNLFVRFLGNGIVSSRYDLVGHSMGGILSRLYIQEVNPDIAHKIITVNTPHWGSAVADRGQQLRESLRPLLDHVTVAWIYGKIETIYYENPAIYDLMSTSNAIKALGNKAHVIGERRIPVHAVCSYLEESQTTTDKTKKEIAADLLIAELGGFFADEDLNDGQDLLKWTFNGEQNDGIVEIKSQKGGLPEKHCTIESEAYSGPVGSNSNAFHTMTTKWSETHENLEALLKASVSDDRFDVNGFKTNDTKDVSFTKKRTQKQNKAITNGPSFITIGSNLRVENDSVKIDIDLNHSDDIVKNMVFGFLDEDKVVTGFGRNDYTLLFPNTYSGGFKLYALGRSANDEIVADSVILEIPAVAAVRYITFIGDPSNMSLGQQSKFSVKAIWSNGEETYIEPEFTTSDNSVLMVNGNYIEAVGEGSCMLTAIYKGHTTSVMLEVKDYGEIDGLQEIRSEGEYKIYNDGETLYLEAPDARIRNIELRLFDASGTLIQNLHATTNGNKKAFSLDLGNRKGLFVVQCISDDFKGSYRFVY